jgi:tetratricopeptide (TPR) repeat protein
MRRYIAAAALALAVALGAVGAARGAIPGTTERVDTQPTPAPFELDTKAVVTAARSKVAADDLPGAIKLLAVYYAAHPQDPLPARLLGDLYYRAGDLAKAEDTYRHILAIYPNDKETHNRLGAALAAENRVDEAIVQYEASLPGTDAVYDLVALHQRRGDLAHYIAQLESAAQTAPNSSDAQAELAQAYLAVYRLEDARTYFNRALNENPQSLTAFNGIALVDMDEHNYDGAFDMLGRCLVLDPDNYSCTVNEAAADLETADYGKAEPLLKRANALAPERPEALVNFGYLADMRNDWKTAAAWYLKALEMSPYSRDAYFNLGLEYELHALYPQAQAVLIKGLAVAPTDGGLHDVLGMTYRALGENDLARIQFQQAATSLDPRYATLARTNYAELTATPSPRS